MNLDDVIITCFCWIDEMLPRVLKGQRLRQRGPAPQLADSEVLTMEVVGTYLGLSQDSKVFAYVHTHYAHFFPALGKVHRTTFVRQAANLWASKERLWMLLRDSLIQHECVGRHHRQHVVAGLPFCACPLVCALSRRSSLRERPCGSTDVLRLSPASAAGLAGRDYSRLLAPANEPDGEMAPIVLEATQGIVLGDRAYWVPDTHEMRNEI